MYKIYTKKTGMPWWYAYKFLLIMRLTTVLLIATIMEVSASSYAQNITFAQKDVTLDKVFSVIRKQTGYNVFFTAGELKETDRINADFKNTPLNDVLNKIIKGKQLKYEIEDKTIILKKEIPSFLTRIKTYFATINVNGKIIDAETGLGIPKATVKLKNSNRMVVGDNNGSFLFYGLKDDDILVFSTIGYVSREVKAKDGMIVKLSAAVKELEDVIVSTGYQQIKQSSVTGAYTVITAKEIESTPSVNLMERLEGKVPGVKFDLRNNSIQIRGVSAFSANPPLVVIDGFPAINQKLTTITSGTVEGSVSYDKQPETSGNAILSTFNPADIETITFLKDAAATAIWGANAANGVIVITTKRGRKGTSSINFNSSISTSAPANFKNMTSMSNREYIDFEQELFDKNFSLDPLKDWRNRPVSEAQEWMFRVKRKTATPAERDAALDVLANRSNRDQLQEYMLQRAVTQQHNLSFSGGAENSSYYISGNYTKDRPVFRSNVGESYSVLSNLTNDFLNKRISLSTGLGYTYSKSQVNAAAIQSLSVGQFGLAPYQMLVDENGNRIYSDIALSRRASDSLLVSNRHLPWTYNPIDELNYNNTINTRSSFRVNATLKGVITDWLNLTVSGQIQKGIDDQAKLQNLDSYLGRELVNKGTFYRNGRMVYGYPLGGTFYTSKSNSDDYGLRAQLNIQKTWNDVHSISVIGGTEIRQSKSSGSMRTLYGYNEELSTSANVNTTGIGTNGTYETIFNVPGRFSFVGGNISKSTRRYLSHYGTASYSYLGKYYATGSVRFDDINLLGVDRRDRATPLWSAGLRWDAKKEDFMSKINWINSLSFRATLGTAGQPPSTSANFAIIAIGQPDSYSQLPSVYLNAPANQNIGWETTKTTNGGMDVNMLNNRLNLQVDVYRKNSYDLIMSLPLSSTYGFNSLSYNAGDLTGHGIEFNLNGELIRTKEWNWSSGFNFSYNTNKVTDVRFPNKLVQGGRSATITGYPIDNLFVYRWAGLDNTGQSQVYQADGTKVPSKPNKQLKAEDLSYAGRTTSPYFGGLTTAVSYKNFSLSARATYYLGHVFLLQSISQSYYPTDADEGGQAQFQGLLANNKLLASRWRNPGDENHTNVPGISNGNINSLDMFMNSDLNVRDAGNIRLQQVSLSYSAPKSLLRRIPAIKAINLGLTVSNLGLLWVANKEGIDPGYQMTSEYNNLPPTRNYVLNLNLTL